MSQRALTLPLRTRIVRSPWICRRCLATQADTAPSPPIDNAFSRADTAPAPPIDDTFPQAGRPFETPRKNPILAAKLAHRIPSQYLQHSTSDDLNLEEKQDRDKAKKHKEIRGVVVSAGMMDKTVRVRVPGRRWNRRIGKV